MKPSPAGVIAGALIAGDTGQPVRKAQVRINDSRARISQTTTSDAEGRFRFDAVAPGEYVLSASKPGYLEMQYGARRPGLDAPAAPVGIVAGQNVGNLKLALPRGGVITGTVLDEFGDPAFNVPVRALRYIWQQGYRALTTGGNAMTDDRGMYRIAGLMPGEYLVAAMPRDTVSAQAAQSEALRDRQAQVLAAAKKTGQPPPPPPPPPSLSGYVNIYYPGTPSGALTSPVTVGLTQEVAGIDIRLQVVETGTLAGTITSAEATLPQTRLQLIDTSMPMNNVGIWFRDMRPDGSFSFAGLVPGTYLLKGFGTPGGEKGVAGGEMWGSVEVTVAPGRPTQTVLPMQRGVTVSGRLALDTAPPGLDRSRLRLRLYPISSPTDWEMPVWELPLDPDGRFSIRNVVPGTFQFRISGLPDGWAIGSAMFGERDAAEYHLHIDGSRPLTGGELRLTSRTAELHGTVSNEKGMPVRDYAVMLFPAERQFWLPQSRRIQWVQPGADGRFTFRGLPAGEYRLVALFDPEPGRQFDHEFLSRLLGGAIEVTLGEGERRTQDIRVK